MKNKTEFFINVGTVQCFVCRDTPFYTFHFGRPQYDRNKPILSDSIKKQAQPIVDLLNAGSITIDEAEKLLSKIYY